ncbi:MAG: GGDEF domain-containing protein [Lachnospiraceae bacterium]|nr:GGDEF domain-containing protein [Lachnospiraceae bacterium]
MILYNKMGYHNFVKGLMMNDIGRKRLAVITMNMDNAYSVEILRGILEEAKICGCDIAIFNAFINQDELIEHNVGQFNIYNLANLKLFDGVIFLSNLIKGHAVYDKTIDRLKKAEIPVVSVDTPLPDFYYVGAENYRSMKAIVEHFIKHHGFTRINCVSGPPYNPDAEIRLKAYKDALKENGLPVEEERISMGIFSHQNGREAAAELLKRAKEGEELPQAIVCGNDDIAVGVSMELQEHGVRVPQDVAVSGFDNGFEAINSVPRLTTVDRPLADMGRKAVLKIWQILDGKVTAVSELLPSVPIFAGSCGCEFVLSGKGEDIRLKYLKMTELFERYLVRNTFMTEELNDSTSFDDMLKRLKGYVDVLGANRFYYCLDSGLVQYLRLADKSGSESPLASRLRTDGYAPVMSVVLAYEKGEFVEYEDFPTSEMLPGVDTSQDEANVFVFSPVHFRDRCYGYVVVEGSEFVLNSMLYRNWLVNMTNGLESIRKQANLQRTLRQVDKLYVTDPLTGLYNRSGFARHTADSFRVCAREKVSVMILFADMDGLKKINDRYGHDKGDAAIIAVAEALKGACLDSEVCARFGGDEYVVYAEDYSEADARRFCARFESGLEHYNMKKEQPFLVAASCGYRVFVPGEGDLIDKYIDSADEQMYEVKRAKYSR